MIASCEKKHFTTRIVMRFIAFPLAACILGGLEASERPAKPNIIIMMADDMGIGDTSAYLNVRLNPNATPIARTLRTPNLQRFAQSAIVFTDGYAPASMCSSTRYSLLTGRFAHRSYLKNQGWLPHGPNVPMIQKALTTMPEMLQANGYRTSAVGKYHVGMSFDNGKGKPATDFYFHDVDFTKALLDGPIHHGFHEYFGVPGNTEDSLDTEPRILIRNNHFIFTDRSRMKRIGMKQREGEILSAPDWDLRMLGPLFLQEAQAFIARQSQQTKPFFLYYVPCANHLQTNLNGDYAVPDEIAGTPIKGQSRYSDGDAAGDREDMVLENDVALGQLLSQLRTLDDPRWPGHKLIDNTLVIFTSDNGPNVGDNLGRNQESGGLRGKKAKIWEGGIRVPLIVSWPSVLEGGKQNRSIVTLTDLYATLARIVGHQLTPNEAQDSYDVFDYWTATAEAPDTRPRVFFCHLGPPYLNDVLAIRVGKHKLIVDGGLAMPWAPWSSQAARGSSVPKIFYDLDRNLYEDGDFLPSGSNDNVFPMAASLLRIHNRGYARELDLKDGSELFISPGWHNIRNDVSGEIGFEFKLSGGSGPKEVTHLGMWDDHDRDKPIRPARSIPANDQSDQPSAFPVQDKRRRITAPHVLRLLQLEPGGKTEIARIMISAGQGGQLHQSFRYFRLKEAVTLRENIRYLLLMSTKAADGDSFRDPVSFDGLPPLIHPDVQIQRSLRFHLGDPTDGTNIPAFEDMNDSFSQHRAPVGPTLRFGSF